MSVKSYESAVLNGSVARAWDTVRRLDFVWDSAHVLGVKNVAHSDREVLSWTVGDVLCVYYLGVGLGLAVSHTKHLRITALSDAERTVSFDVVDAKGNAVANGESSTIRVRPITATNTAFIEWTTTFASADAATLAASAKEKREQFDLLNADVSKTFTFHTTAEDAVRGQNVKGRTFVVTGANAGLGFETARVLAAHGGHVIITARDSKKAAEAAAEIKRGAGAGGDAKVEGMACALDSFASIRAFAKEYIARGYPLHVLILNAGVMATPYGKTENGFETQFGVNHVGHFLLTSLLTPVLKKSAPARVVSLTSWGHRFSGIRFDDPNFEKPNAYQSWLAYGQSKTANILFAKQLNARFKADGVAITGNAVHPGVIMTTLAKHADAVAAKAAAEQKESKSGGAPLPGRLEIPSTLKTMSEGVASTLVAAVQERYATEGGHYFEDCNPYPAQPHAADMKAAEQLWAFTEKLIADTKA